MDFLFVTGMSGAGKTVAVNELEDMGYFCVDNIPSGLIGAFARLCEQSPVGGRIALVTDFRSGEQFARFPEALDQLTAEGHTYCILMLEAEDSVILRRYKENRRRHPLLEEGSAGLEAAIRTERKLLEPIRLRADYRIDTSFITIAQLRERVEQLFGDDSGKMIVTCMSFGYKYGIPAETDLLFDVRCLPNPFYVPELREHTRPGTGSPGVCVGWGDLPGTGTASGQPAGLSAAALPGRGQVQPGDRVRLHRRPAPVGDLCRTVPGASGPEGIPGSR